MPSLRPFTKNCFTQHIRPSLLERIDLAMQVRDVREDMQLYVLEPIATRIERLAPSVAWPTARQNNEFFCDHLYYWPRVRRAVEYTTFAPTYPQTVFTAMEAMEKAFTDLTEQGLIPEENAIRAEAMHLQLCHLYNPETLLHFAEAHAFFNVWGKGTLDLPAFVAKPMGSSREFIYKIRSDFVFVEHSLSDALDEQAPEHFEWLRDPATLAGMMKTAGAQTPFRATVAKVLENPADERWRAPLQTLLAKSGAPPQTLSWEQALSAFANPDPREDGVGPELIDFTKFMRSYVG
jgi:hypothetical protein